MFYFGVANYMPMLGSGQARHVAKEAWCSGAGNSTETYMGFRSGAQGDWTESATASNATMQAGTAACLNASAMEPVWNQAKTIVKAYRCKAAKMKSKCDQQHPQSRRIRFHTSNRQPYGSQSCQN